jgi:hypothetical protein
VEARSWGLQRKRTRGGQHGRVYGGVDAAHNACLIGGLLRDGRTRKQHHGKWVRVSGTSEAASTHLCECFHKDREGDLYVVTPDCWRADFQVLDKASGRDGHVSTRKSFVVDRGQSGLVDA